MADRAPISPGPGSLAPPGDGPRLSGCLLSAVLVQFVLTVPVAGFLWLLHLPWWGGPQDPALVDWLVSMLAGTLALSYCPWLLLAVFLRPRGLLAIPGAVACSPLLLALGAALAER